MTTIPQGAEFQVNTTTAGDQQAPSVTVLSNGGFVVTWESQDQDGDGNGVYGQRYDADGKALGDEFQINTITADSQQDPSVTALSDGGFVVTWNSEDDDEIGGVYGRRYNAEGEAQDTKEFQINTTTIGSHKAPSVAALSGGGFVVAWYSESQDQIDFYFDVLAQRYDADGTAQGTEFLVNATKFNDQYDPSVTALSNGGFVVAWASSGQDSDGLGVYAQRYDADGTALGGEFLVNTTTADDQEAPSVTALTDGGFVVTWESNNQDGQTWGIYGQRYDADGMAQGTEFQINQTTDDSQYASSVTGLSEGGFVVTWRSDGNQDGSDSGVYGRRYAADGKALGDEFPINTTTAGNQGNPSVKALTDGGFVVAWESADQNGSGDGSGNGVFGQRFELVETIQGTDGNDTLKGIEKVDLIEGLAGNDKIVGSLGADTLDGGGGYDRAFYKGSDAGVNVNLGDSNAEQGGFAQDDVLIGIEHLIGSKFADTLTGNGRNNRFDGGRGDDSLTGGAGNDWLTGGAGMDTLNGGAGIDWAVYKGSNEGVTVNLGDSIAEQGGHAQGDVLTGIEHLIGSKFADSLTGNDENNRFDGGAGDDALNGGAGNDWLTGGLGADRLDGGEGFDRAVYKGSNEAVTVHLDGTAGEGGHAQGDVLTGIEVLIGSGHGDTLNGNAGDNRIDGGAGIDWLKGGAGIDWLKGGAGADTLDGGEGFDRAIYKGSDEGVTVSLADGTGEGGHAQGDTLTNIQNLTGSGHRDTLIGDAGDNRIDGGAGNDSLNGGAGNDWLTGGAGADTLDGGAEQAIYGISDRGVTVNLANLAGIGNLGDRAIYAGSNVGVTVNLSITNDDGATIGMGGHAQGDVLTGIEHLTGSKFADALTGNQYHNRFDGGAGNDSLTGGDGNDWLTGGRGMDMLEGGDGNDRAIYKGSDAGVTVNLSITNDDGATIGMGGHAQGDVLTGIEHLTGSDRADALTGNEDHNRFDGGTGNDSLTGGAGNDWLTGGAGADTLDGGEQGDVDSGDGFDRAIYAGSGEGVKVSLGMTDENGNTTTPGTGEGGHAQGDVLTGIEDLTGSKFADTLTGNNENNRFDGGTGNDSLDGGAGNDWLKGGAGRDTLNGGDGNDWAIYAGSNAGVSVNLVTGTAERGGHAEGDVLIDIENLIGSKFVDTLTGDDGVNLIDGGAGDDVLDGGAGSDVLSGHRGFDRAIYARSDAGVNVNLDIGLGQGGHAAGDVLTDIEFLTGSDHNDTLTGGADTLPGGADKNRFDGGAGDDVLDGGAGADRLDGGDGFDRAAYARSDRGVTVNLATGTALGGHAEGDTLMRIEHLTGSTHGDSLTGDDGNNRLDGGAGADMLDGGAGDDRAVYADSNAGVTVNLADGTAEQGGHAAGDTLIGIEDLTGSDHADRLTGDDGDNRLDGGAGNDSLTGGAGADALDGGGGSDRAIYADSGVGVTVNLATGTGVGGHAQGDVLTGIEDLTGSDRNDSLTGDIGNNRLDGGAGADMLTGGAGRDMLDGGLGVDRAIYAGSNAGVWVDVSGFAMGGHAEGDTLMHIENLTGSDHNDTLYGGDGENRLDGGKGNDSLIGRAGDDWLTGGAGRDTLNGDDGIDRAIYADSDEGVTVNLADGIAERGGHAQGDFLLGIEDLTGSDFADTLTGNGGENRLDGGAGNDSLTGGAGNDILVGSLGDDTLDGGAGSDRAVYAGSDAAVSVNLSMTNDDGATVGMGGHAQNDVLTGIEDLTGSDFADTLTGNGGDNRLDGGAGDDVLDGGVGSDSLTGGAGADIFVFNPVFGALGLVKDTIADFEDGTDIVRIHGASFGDLTITDSGGDASVTWDGNTLTFTGLDRTLLTADDFAFV